uniref:Threonine/homoserine/homoserine lactone efflux protein n=1 Tax=uncultured Thiotrichaceae bacterium TaxID=298394 RepID=A0A6S6SSF7_9GAMM|nr:MAG: Threonine/homoserine/homoserine lactone efflux protein [uncultured Thiotrichaceae bacterium]
MIGFESWLVFASIGFVAAITPGPAILLTTSHAVAYGLRYAIATMLGNATGLLIMATLSALGVSTVILYSPTIFLVLKLLGAGYLIYLGVKLLRHGFGSSVGSGIKAKSTPPHVGKLYAHGLMVALSNPKAIAFTTALFPQFIDHTQSVLPQFVLLTLTFLVLSLSCLLGYAYLAESTKNRTKSVKFPNILSKLFGGTFILSGILLAGTSQE